MGSRISFFDAIDANKRNSLLLMGVMFVLYAAMLAAFSYFFRIGIFGYLVGLGVLVVYFVGSYYAGPSLILAVSGAKKIQKKDDPFLFNVVEGLALAAGIPVPDVYIIDDPAPNAFATGRDPKHSAVAFTTGLRRMLSREELEGVAAHEISHIGNYDIRYSMIAVVFAGAMALLAEFAMRMFFFGGHRNRDRGGGGGLMTIIALAVLVLAPIIAMFVRLAISRQREYLADATAAKLTRYPPGLASALEKITAQHMNVKNATDTTASLYISNPLPKHFSLLSTHPNPKDRIERLKRM